MGLGVTLLCALRPLLAIRDIRPPSSSGARSSRGARPPPASWPRCRWRPGSPRSPCGRRVLEGGRALRRRLRRRAGAAVRPGAGWPSRGARRLPRAALARPGARAWPTFTGPEPGGRGAGDARPRGDADRGGGGAGGRTSRRELGGAGRRARAGLLLHRHPGRSGGGVRAGDRARGAARRRADSRRASPAGRGGRRAHRARRAAPRGGLVSLARVRADLGRGAAGPQHRGGRPLVDGRPRPPASRRSRWRKSWRGTSAWGSATR